MNPAVLLERLDRGADALGADGPALALIGLRSLGLNNARLDAHSDLDFFVIVGPGWKERFVRSLDWLAAASAQAPFIAGWKRSGFSSTHW